MLPLSLLMYSLDLKSYCGPKKDPRSSHEVMLHENRSQKLSYLSTFSIRWSNYVLSSSSNNTVATSVAVVMVAAAVVLVVVVVKYI